jgi:SAM-dependent methyltransferase
VDRPLDANPQSLRAAGASRVQPLVSQAARDRLAATLERNDEDKGQVKAMSGLEEPVSWLPLVQRMRCPQCGAGVTREAAGVRCVNGHHYPERHGYLDFSVPGPSSGSTEATLASFGFEWTSFDDIRAEDEAFASIYFADLDLEALTGKVGLDAGCGKGRFTRVLARHLAATVALDGSVAVEAAARNLADMDNVVVVRSDLRDAPFAPESFEFISSLGVLHHLDDPRDGFRQLVRYLAPGGQMLVYLYSRPKGIEVRSVALSARRGCALAGLRAPGGMGRATKREGLGRPAHEYLPGQAFPISRPRHLRPAERTGRASLRLV